MAPIYDVSSILPYAPQVQFQEVKLAMKIGGEYRLGDISLRSWTRFADENRLHFDEIRTRIAAIADRLPDLACSVRDDVARKGAGHVMNDRLAAAFADRSKSMRDQLSRRSPAQ